MSEELLKPDGERIKRYRNQEGLNQTDFGGKAGVSRDFIYKIEKGALVRGTTLRLVAEKAMGMELKDILADNQPHANEPDRTDKPGQAPMSAKDREIRCDAHRSDIPVATEATEQNPSDAHPASFWNIPPQTPYFCGREDALPRLRAALTSKAPWASIQALCGLGGVGKTQLAIAYAERYKAEYKVGWWLRADNPAELAAGYMGLAHSLRLAERGADERMIIRAVREWLEQNPDWLLVFNNAANQENLFAYLPSNPPGHVLITSRTSIWQDIAASFPVDVFEPAESVRFLLNRTRPQTGSPQQPTDSDAAENLAEMLGHLPLALEQAAAYMLALRVSFEQYAQSYCRRKVEIFGGQSRAGQKPVLIPMTGGYTETVLTTWAMNIEEVQAGSPAAVDVLCLGAFLAPDRISLQLLAGGGDCLGPAIARAVDHEPPDPLAVKELLLPLAYFSLVACDEQWQSFSIHRLVQEVVRFQLTPEERRLWTERKMTLLLSQWQSTHAADRPLRPELVTHAETLLHNAEEVDVDPAMAAQIFHLAGNYLIYEASQYARAQRFAAEAAALCGRYDIPDRIRAEGLCLLATVYWYQGELSKADPLEQEASGIYQAALQAGEAIDEAAMIRLCNVRGLLAYDQGRYGKSERAYRQGLAIGEQTPGRHHNLLMIVQNNLACLYREMGYFGVYETSRKESCYAQAEALFLERLTQEQIRINVGITHANLAHLYARRQQVPEARRHLQEALRILEETLGRENKYFALALTAQGEIFRIQGLFPEARHAIEEALDIQHGAFERPMQHPDAVIKLHGLAEIYLHEAGLTQAEQETRKALTICESIFPPIHPVTMAVLDLLIRILERRKRAREQEIADCKRAKQAMFEKLQAQESQVGQP